jgi:hypothetical protein
MHLLRLDWFRFKAKPQRSKGVLFGAVGPSEIFFSILGRLADIRNVVKFRPSGMTLKTVSNVMMDEFP